jgi:hypothetical protein
MRHGAGGRRGIDPADRDDMKATDKDKDLAKKNMIVQLRKAKDTKGNFSIEFQDGKKQKVDAKLVDALLKAHDGIQKPRDKEAFIGMINKSYRDMLKVAKVVVKQLKMGEEVFLEGFEVEEIEIDEMKMDDPKLNKIFDKLKKGQTIKLKTSSTISKGKDFVDYIVKSKNTVNKGRVEKVTLVTKGNEKSVKKFLYKRDGKVTFAIGDMGASIDDIKEAKSSTGYELYHKDFSSAMKHAYDFAKKKFGIEVDPKEIDDKVATGPKKPSNGKTNSYSLKAKGGKKGIQVQVYNTGKNYELNMYKEEVISEEEEPQKSDGAKAVDQGREDKKKTRIAQLQLQIAKAQETINQLNAQEK